VETVKRSSRGGLTSKIHAVVDTNGLPVRLGLTDLPPTFVGALVADSRTRRWTV
jgi:hypothetical protein